MSQVAQAIVATSTGEYKAHNKLSPLFQDVFNTKSTIQGLNSGYGEIYKVYRIGATIGGQCHVREDESLGEAIKRTKMQVIEAIFGEFRPHLRRIEQAIYNYDMETAGKLLHEMEDQMFNP